MFVIPTRFDRDVQPLVDACREAKAGRTIVVHTELGHPDVHGVWNVRDVRRNISHWWISGLAYCDDRAVLLNDDIHATPEALKTIAETLRTADLVTLPKPLGTTPLTGWCFGLRPDVLFPDPAYVWFYSEDTIWMQAKTRGLRITTVDVRVTHDRGSRPDVPPEFVAQVEADRARFYGQWGAHL